METVRLPKQKLQIPLIIGTIPLKEDADQFEDELDTIAESLQEAFGRKAPSMQFAESVWGKTELNTNQRRVSQAGYHNIILDWIPELVMFYYKGNTYNLTSPVEMYTISAYLAGLYVHRPQIMGLL